MINPHIQLKLPSPSKIDLEANVGFKNYDTLSNKPRINGHELIGDLTAEQLELIKAHAVPTPILDSDAVNKSYVDNKDSKIYSLTLKFNTTQQHYDFVENYETVYEYLVLKGAQRTNITVDDHILNVVAASSAQENLHPIYYFTYADLSEDDNQVFAGIVTITLRTSTSGYIVNYYNKHLLTDQELKTINGESIIGSGNIEIQPGSDIAKTTALLKGDNDGNAIAAQAGVDYQAPITDLNTIRENAESGANAYHKPTTGIPKSDLNPTALPQKVSDLENDSGFVTGSQAVRFDTAQTIAPPQQITARTNIGAVGFGDLPTKVSDLENDNDFVNSSQAVRFDDAQSLRESEKITARANIGAASQTDLLEVESIAKGAQKAIAYNDYESAITALNAAEKTDFFVGQSIYIREKDVPDLWISTVNPMSVVYEYTTDEAVIESLKSPGYIDTGWFSVSALETGKVDLTNYVHLDSGRTSITDDNGDLDVYAEGDLSLHGETSVHIGARLGNVTINDLADPINNLDATNKKYVDDRVMVVNVTQQSSGLNINFDGDISSHYYVDTTMIGDPSGKLVQIADFIPSDDIVGAVAETNTGYTDTITENWIIPMTVLFADAPENSYILGPDGILGFVFADDYTAEGIEFIKGFYIYYHEEEYPTHISKEGGESVYVADTTFAQIAEAYAENKTIIARCNYLTTEIPETFYLAMLHESFGAIFSASMPILTEGRFENLVIYPSDEIEYAQFEAAYRSAVPTKTSDLTNDSGFMTSHQAVRYDATQSLSPMEKALARGNIGAGTSDFSGDYDDLTNKPSIPQKVSDLTNDSNYVTVSQAVRFDDVQGLQEGEKAIARANIGAAAEADIPAKVSDLENDSGFLTNTNYASTSVAGVVKTNGPSYGVSTGTDGNIRAYTLTAAQYASASNYALIGKATLENVLTAKTSNDISAQSTDSQLASAKAVYDFIMSLDGNGVAY